MKIKEEKTKRENKMAKNSYYLNAFYNDDNYDELKKIAGNNKGEWNGLTSQIVEFVFETKKNRDKAFNEMFEICNVEIPDGCN